LYTSIEIRVFFNKLLFKISPNIVLDKINKNLIQKVKYFSPHVLVIFKGMEIYPKTLQEIKEKGVKLVNYNLDHPLEYFSKGSGDKNVYNSVDLYDLHISYSQDILNTLLERDENAQTAHLPFGHFVTPDLYEECKKIKTVKKVCFVGNPDQKRVDYINRFCDAGLNIDVYGTGWSNLLIEKNNLKIYPPAYGDDYWKTLRRYAVQLNIFRPHNKNSHNMRTFEVPAIGGIMLAPRSNEHSLFFKEGEEVFLYDDVEQAIKIAQRLLSRSDDEIERTRNNARQRSLIDGYHYRERSKLLLKYLNQLF
jgi:spore maturation protein CgeB